MHRDFPIQEANLALWVLAQKCADHALSKVFVQGFARWIPTQAVEDNTLTGLHWIDSLIARYENL